MISFKNPGLIDLLSITTFGASVKESKNPIGQFGTGLKYAIAVLLRNDCPVYLLVGKDQYVFGMKPQRIRGKEFELVTMMNSETMEETLCGFTTELGKGWELWMAYRELACNCMDEGGAIVSRSYDDSEEGHTCFQVYGEKFVEIYDDRTKYILEGPASIRTEKLNIRFQPSQHVYYRSIRVSELQKPAIFEYNIQRTLELTEDRTMKYPHILEELVVKAVCESTDEDFIRAVVMAADGTYEHSLGFLYYGSYFGETFKKVMIEEGVRNRSLVNASALAALKMLDKAAFMPVPTLLSKVQEGTFKRAVKFCQSIGFPVLEFPIIVVDSLGDTVLGSAIGETSYISIRVFELGGAKMLASTMIEEYLHLKHGYQDCSRELQQFLFDKIVGMGEEMNGEGL